MRTVASLMDFSQSALILTSLSTFQFCIINISLYIVPASVFWSSSYSTSLRIIVKYVTYTFTIRSPPPIQTHTNIYIYKSDITKIHTNPQSMAKSITTPFSFIGSVVSPSPNKFRVWNLAKYPHYEI